MKKNNSRQSIGIIGGMGPQASAKLLEVLIEMSVKEFGAKNDEDFPEIILNSVAVPNFISTEENIETVLNILKSRVAKLEKFNPSCFAIACNTAHLLLKDLQANTDIPFVSIIDEVAKKVEKAKIKKIGLLGTPVTIKFRLYQTRLAKNNIAVIVPSEKELLIVEGIIRNVLADNINEKNKQKLVSIANTLKLRGAEGIMLGCTELPLIFPKNFSLPIFDSIEILAKALLKRFFESKKNKYEENYYF